MKIKSLIRLIEIEGKLFMREPPAFFFTLLFPIMLLLIFGMIFNFPSGYGDFKVIELYVPCLISMIIASVGLIGIPIVIAEYREQGVFRQYKATPLHPALILTAQTVVNFIMTLGGTILLIIIGTLVYKIRFSGDILSIGIAFTLSCASFFSLGFMISGLTKSTRSTHAIGMSFFFPMLFLSGAAIPSELFPVILKKIIYILPLTHVVDLLKGVWMGTTLQEHLIPIIVLFTMLILCTLISFRKFQWE